MIKNIWSFRALESEICFSTALGGKLEKHDGFWYIRNSSPAWGGDFNRALALSFRSSDEFEKIEEKVKGFFTADEIDPPFRFDLLPGIIRDEEEYPLYRERGYNVTRADFYNSPTMGKKSFIGYKLHQPLVFEYKKWFKIYMKMSCRLDELTQKRLLPAKLKFVEKYKPYFLKKEGRLIGWCYMCVLGEYARLFEVEILPVFRGKGYGTILLNMMKIEAGRQGANYLLIQTDEKTSPFYRKNGFTLCSSNHILWRHSKWES